MENMRKKKRTRQIRLRVISVILFVCLALIIVILCVKGGKKEITETETITATETETETDQTVWQEPISLVMIGDSYGFGLQTMGENVTGWPYLIQQQIPLSESAIEVKPGVGFAREEDGETFDTLLNKSFQSIASPQDVEYVLVCGGYNDAYADPGYVESAIHTFIYDAKELYPNAEILLGIIGWDRNDPMLGEMIVEQMVPTYRMVASQYEGG